MKQLRWWAAGAVLAACGFALGTWNSGGKTVHAAADDLQFQLRDVGTGNSLLIYSPAQKTIYVYQGAVTGGSSLQCSFKFILTTPGGLVRRQNCDVPAFQP